LAAGGGVETAAWAMLAPAWMASAPAQSINQNFFDITTSLQAGAVRNHRP